MDLLAFFFPNAIDTLSREEGIVDGPLPIIFSGFLEADLPIETMILGTQDASIEFGAEQCIVVRDEESRGRASKQDWRGCAVPYYLRN